MVVRAGCVGINGGGKGTRLAMIDELQRKKDHQMPKATLHQISMSTIIGNAKDGKYGVGPQTALNTFYAENGASALPPTHIYRAFTVEAIEAESKKANADLCIVDGVPRLEDQIDIVSGNALQLVVSKETAKSQTAYRLTENTEKFMNYAGFNGDQPSHRRLLLSLESGKGALFRFIAHYNAQCDDALDKVRLDDFPKYVIERFDNYAKLIQPTIEKVPNLIKFEKTEDIRSDSIKMAHLYAQRFL